MGRAQGGHFDPPVSQLLTYGETEFTGPDAWPNYLTLGLGPEHISDLVRMAKDPKLNDAFSDSVEVNAPLHAIRALGQLRRPEAIQPLLSRLIEKIPDTETDDEWPVDELTVEEIAHALSLIGPVALPALAAFIADTAHDEEACFNALPGVERIGLRWPESRSDSVAILTKQLERFAENWPTFNAYLIVALSHLHATEAAPNFLLPPLAISKEPGQR